jgi:hypothetical protein
MTTLPVLAYEAALHSLDKQEQLLGELRSRTGAILGASSLAVSFLGRPALDAEHPWLAVLALIAFVVSLG